MFLEYDPKENCVRTLDDNLSAAHDEYSYETRSGEILEFKCDGQQLFVKVPFFLCETFFYKFENKKFLITNKLVNFKNLEIDPVAVSIMSEIGYLPLSRSMFKGVEVLCSFCTYRVSNSVDSIDGNFPVSPELLGRRSFDISDVYKRFKKRLESDLERFRQYDNLLLLSGGIDSRLLLDTLIKCSSKTINVQTHGMPGTGDVIQAHKIVKLDSIKDRVNFNWSNLQNFNSNDLSSNYVSTFGFLPSTRLLYFPSDRAFKSCVLFSGLYGDVIFADNKRTSSSFSSYCTILNSTFLNNTDRLLIAAYDQLPNFEKLNQVLLRCQKLTRFSFEIDKTSKISIPFLDNDVIYLASVGPQKNLYSRLVKLFMEEKLSTIFHQSSCSVFTHPMPLRIITKIYNRFFRTKLSRPYFYNYPVIEEKGFEADLSDEFCKPN